MSGMFPRATLVVLALFASASAWAAEKHNPIVVELFTSQGCSSCPAADAFLDELNHRENILALGFHVDYWDYLGWKDTFASPLTTARQYSYKKALGARTVYTPQMVIGGTTGVIGSRRNEVADALDEAMPPMLGVEISREREGMLTVGLPVVDSMAGKADVWIVMYHSTRKQQIERGENAGLLATYINVVSEYHRLGGWNGQAATFDLDIRKLRAEGRDRAAVIVQRAGAGEILGAVEIDLDMI